MGPHEHTAPQVFFGLYLTMEGNIQAVQLLNATISSPAGSYLRLSVVWFWAHSEQLFF